MCGIREDHYDERDDPQSIDIDPEDDGELATTACVECGAEVVAGLGVCPKCGSFAVDDVPPPTRNRQILTIATIAAFAIGTFWCCRCYIF